MRVLGGSLAALFATSVAGFSHVLAGGALPSAAAIALSLALSIPLCIALAGPAVSLWRTMTAVAVTQAIFHLLFSGISSSGTITMSSHVGHDGAGITAAGAGTVESSSHSVSMWLAHAVAGVLTVLALRYCESALRRLRETASLFIGSLTIVPTTVHFLGEIRAARIGCSTRVLVHDLTLLFSALRHRGPPALSAA
jgi:hypothetical protein